MINGEILENVMYFNRSEVQHALGRMLTDAQYILLCNEYWDLADELSFMGSTECITSEYLGKELQEYLKRIKEM